MSKFRHGNTEDSLVLLAKLQELCGRDNSLNRSQRAILSEAENTVSANPLEPTRKDAVLSGT